MGSQQDVAAGFRGPQDRLGPECVRLGDGLWLTRGRTAVLEGERDLTAIDPGDEPCGTWRAPAGPLRDVLDIEERTGKRLGWVLVTHAHPDHVANLPIFRRERRVRVVAHAHSPLEVDLRVEDPLLLEAGVAALSTPGHSRAGDDLSFWHPPTGTLFSGDLVQPKGETWESAFYPSPYVYFWDGAVYLASLRRLLEFPLQRLVTGHREVRDGAAARRWIELTVRSIEAVDLAVRRWDGTGELRVAGPEIYRALARERGIPEVLIDARLRAPAGRGSAFEQFDLPGIAYFWERSRGRGEEQGSGALSGQSL